MAVGDDGRWRAHDTEARTTRVSGAALPRSRPDDLESVAHLLGIAALVTAGCAVAAHWGAGPWPVVLGAAVVIAAAGRHLTTPHAALAAVIAWCSVTGFVVNTNASLSFNPADLWRIVVLAAAATLAGVPGGSPNASGADEGL